MKKILYKSNSDGEIGYVFFCPACKCGHRFDKRWAFNGNFEKPTFRPSLLWDDPQSIRYAKDKSQPVHHRCHSYVTDGKIEYLNDCTHELAGKTVDLEAF